MVLKCDGTDVRFVGRLRVRYLRSSRRGGLVFGEAVDDPERTCCSLFDHIVSVGGSVSASSDAKGMSSSHAIPRGS